MSRLRPNLRVLIIAAYFTMVAGSSVAQKNAAEPQIHSASIGHGIRLQAVQRISVPVLILMGAKSYPFLGVIGRELARLLPKSKTIVFPDAGHQMWLQDPGACRHDVEKFLADFAIR
jgi:pimeloyl-ACP methyl ester carboxylesterase